MYVHARSFIYADQGMTLYYTAESHERHSK